MPDYDPNRIDHKDEAEDTVETWEVEWAKKAIAPYLDADGNVDLDKLNAACEPLDESMQEELDDALS